MNKKTRNQLIIGGITLVGAYLLYQRVLKPKSSDSEEVEEKLYEEDPYGGGIGGGMGGGVPSGGGGFPTGNVGVGLGIPSYGGGYVVVEEEEDEEETTKDCWSGCPSKKITIVGETCPTTHPFADQQECAYTQTEELPNPLQPEELADVALPTGGGASTGSGGTGTTISMPEMPSLTCWSDACPSESQVFVGDECPAEYPLSSKKFCPIVATPVAVQALPSKQFKSFDGNGYALSFDGEEDYAEVFLPDDADLNRTFGDF
jgi:hypothetical protein